MSATPQTYYMKLSFAQESINTSDFFDNFKSQKVGKQKWAAVQESSLSA